MRRAHVTRPYRAQHVNPIRFAMGDIVTIGERDERWPGWIWTTTADGNAGGAPVDWLRPLDGGRAQALRGYRALEATVEAGDSPAFCWEYGGWCWVILDVRSFGWVPASHLVIGPELPDPPMEEVATGWINYWIQGGPENPVAAAPFRAATVTLGYWAHMEPERAWDSILEIQRRPEAIPYLGVLAAGPLEDLLGAHGSAMIDRIEAQAGSSARFARLLAGVWKDATPGPVRDRVQAACAPTNRCGIPQHEASAGH